MEGERDNILEVYRFKTEGLIVAVGRLIVGELGAGLPQPLTG